MTELSRTINRRTALWAALAAAGAAQSAAPAAAATSKAGSDKEIGTVWWVELVTRDMAQAQKFYTKTIGWNSKTVAMDDATRAPKAGEAGYTMFLHTDDDIAGAQAIDTDDPSKNRPVWIIYFQVENVDSAAKRAVEVGGRIMTAPYDIPGNARLAVMTDADGLLFGLAAPI